MIIPDGFPRISEAQLEALFGLAHDWPWGIDGRTGRSLVKRRWTRPAVKAGPNGEPWVYQTLTREGADLARRLVEANEWESARMKRELRETWYAVFPETKIAH